MEGLCCCMCSTSFLTRVQYVARLNFLCYTCDTCLSGVCLYFNLEAWERSLICLGNDNCRCAAVRPTSRRAAMGLDSLYFIQSVLSMHEISIFAIYSPLFLTFGRRWKSPGTSLIQVLQISNSNSTAISVTRMEHRLEFR